MCRYKQYPEKKYYLFIISLEDLSWFGCNDVEQNFDNRVKNSHGTFMTVGVTIGELEWLLKYTTGTTRSSLRISTPFPWEPLVNMVRVWTWCRTQVSDVVNLFTHSSPRLHLEYFNVIKGTGGNTFSTWWRRTTSPIQQERSIAPRWELTLPTSLLLSLRPTLLGRSLIVLRNWRDFTLWLLPS